MVHVLKEVFDELDELYQHSEAEYQELEDKYNDLKQEYLKLYEDYIANLDILNSYRSDDGYGDFEPIPMKET